MLLAADDGRVRVVRAAAGLRSGTRWSALMLALGLMSKPMLVTLPFVLILLDYWPLAPDSPAAIAALIEKLPLFALVIASSIVTFIVQRQGGAVSTLDVMPISLRIGNALVSYVAYLGKMLWPANLAVFYPFPRGIPPAAIAGAVLLLAAISVLAVRVARTRPYVLVGWLWYVGTLVPVIGLIQVGTQGMADRYTYVPLIGIAIAVAWTAADLPARFRTALAATGSRRRAGADGGDARAGRALAEQPQRSGSTPWTVTVRQLPRAQLARRRAGQPGPPGRRDRALHRSAPPRARSRRGLSHPSQPRSRAGGLWAGSTRRSRTIVRRCG